MCPWIEGPIKGNKLSVRKDENREQETKKLEINYDPFCTNNNQREKGSSRIISLIRNIFGKEEKKGHGHLNKTEQDGLLFEFLRRENKRKNFF
jgi:hypothetical protein